MVLRTGWKAAKCWIVLCVALAGPTLAAAAQGQTGAPPAITLAQLPPQARATIALIRQGGPFPYSRDGTVFGNFEKRLPLAERGYYREYTVPTPGSRSRGARRIVAGRAGELYYTDDHYNTFRRVRE
jgi:ribonuclease T1